MFPSMNCQIYINEAHLYLIRLGSWWHQGVKLKISLKKKNNSNKKDVNSFKNFKMVGISMLFKSTPFEPEA